MLEETETGNKKTTLKERESERERNARRRERERIERTGGWDKKIKGKW